MFLLWDPGLVHSLLVDHPHSTATSAVCRNPSRQALLPPCKLLPPGKLLSIFKSYSNVTPFASPERFRCSSRGPTGACTGTHESERSLHCHGLVISPPFSDWIGSFLGVGGFNPGSLSSAQGPAQRRSSTNLCWVVFSSEKENHK